MDDRKMKYVRLERYDQIIIFPDVLKHSVFKDFNLISAGFCYINQGKVSCFGESLSLGLESMKDDTLKATKQVFGEDAMLKLT